MAKSKSTKKPSSKAPKRKNKPITRPRKRAIRKKRATKKNAPQISYKDSHSIGRRKSTIVPTYSESGRLYYDLHVKYGLKEAFVEKVEKPSKVLNHNFTIESDISDTTTVACNENPGTSSSAKRTKVMIKKQKSVKRRQSIAKVSPLNSRREASLNAAAKVNMLFESSKENKRKRGSLPALSSASVKNETMPESVDESNSEKLSPRVHIIKGKRTRHSEPPHPPVSSPPQKRVAGLNATAIISACIKSPDPDGKKPRRGRPPKSTIKLSSHLSYPKIDEVKSPKNSTKLSHFVTPISSSGSLSSLTATGITSTSQIRAPIPGTPNAITTLATVPTDTKVVPASVMPTLERFQSQKVISYGPKCIGVENISRQIIHVPSQNHSVPGPSSASPAAQQIQQQRIVSHPVVPISSHPSLPLQNNSMLVLPDSSFPPQTSNLISAAAEAQHHSCFSTNQCYLNPFSTTGGQPHQQQQTFYMSVPSHVPQFQFFSAAPFAYMQPSTQTFMQNSSYMFPMSFSPQVYNGFPFGGGCFVPRPMFATVHQPSPHLTPLPQMSLVPEFGNSPHVIQPILSTPQRIDRAVSPIASSPSSSTPVKNTPSAKRNPSTVSPASAITNTSLIEKRKPAPCLWEWVGESSEKYVFLKPNSPPVLRLCYPSMRHKKDGMVVSPGNNVLLCSGPDRLGAPHVAKVTALFADPDTGTKMMALLWYYRPESLVPPRRNGVIDCELFASRHCDVNPVDCIDDLAYVYSALPYARFMAFTKYKQECRRNPRPICIVPPRWSTKNATTTSTVCKLNPAGDVSEFPEEATISNVFLCRAWYDFHSRRVMRNLKALNINNHNTPTTNTNATNNNNGIRHQNTRPVTSSSPVSQTNNQVIKLQTTTVQPIREEESSNGRAVLETTAELSINWADHGEQIAMSLGGAEGSQAKPSPSPRRNKNPRTGSEAASSLPLPSSSSSSS